MLFGYLSFPCIMQDMCGYNFSLFCLPNIWLIKVGTQCWMNGWEIMDVLEIKILRLPASQLQVALMPQVQHILSPLGLHPRLKCPHPQPPVLQLPLLQPESTSVGGKWQGISSFAWNQIQLRMGDFFVTNGYLVEANKMQPAWAALLANYFLKRELQPVTVSGMWLSSSASEAHWGWCWECAFKHLRAVMGKGYLFGGNKKACFPFQGRGTNSCFSNYSSMCWL